LHTDVKYLAWTKGDLSAVLCLYGVSGLLGNLCWLTPAALHLSSAAETIFPGSFTIRAFMRLRIREARRVEVPTHLLFTKLLLDLLHTKREMLDDTQNEDQDSRLGFQELSKRMQSSEWALPGAKKLPLDTLSKALGQFRKVVLIIDRIDCCESPPSTVIERVLDLIGRCPNTVIKVLMTCEARAIDKDSIVSPWKNRLEDLELHQRIVHHYC
jgi:hypothetical protein